MADSNDGQVMFDREERKEEELLLTHLRRIGDDRSGYYAVHIHLSRLRAGNRKPHFINIAARTFENFLSSHAANLFRLSNSDFVLVCRDVPLDDVDPTLYKVRALFSEDPLSVGEEGSIDDKFSTWYDLSRDGDYSAFTVAVATVKEEEEKRARERATLQSTGQTMSGEDIDPSRLLAIGQHLREISIADLIRRQTAVVILPDADGELLFREHYITMPGLQKRLSPGVNLFGNPWLFQYLTEILDTRILSEIARQRIWNHPGPISVNLNINTVMGRDFQNFNREAGDFSKKIIIEFQLIDIFSDIKAYKAARDMLKGRGYRVLIDGLNPLSLQFFDPGPLNADFIKVNWSREFLGDIPAERIDDMRNVVEHAGKAGIILARVDSEEAVQWALNLGITRFQGLYIDLLVEQMVKKGII
jgi:hypothetical protein